jgi:hypothetical protein
MDTLRPEGLIRDSTKNLYRTTSSRGAHRRQCVQARQERQVEPFSRCRANKGPTIATEEQKQCDHEGHVLQGTGKTVDKVRA